MSADAIQQQRHIILVTVSSKLQNQSNHEKPSECPKLRGILRYNLTIKLPKGQAQKGPRNYHKLEETRKMRPKKVTQNLELEDNKDISGKNREKFE